MDALQVTAPRPDYRHTVEVFNREKGLPPGGVPFTLATLLLNALCNDFVDNEVMAKVKRSPMVMDGMLGVGDPRAMVLDFSDAPGENVGVDENP